MARVETKTKSVITEVVLTLTLKEAGVLTRVMGQITGDVAGPRGTADHILDKLADKGIGPLGQVTSGGINFANKW